MKIKLILIIFCFLGVIPKNDVCSPVLTPFTELLNGYNQKRYIIVEGYFMPEINNRYATKLKVTRSSDSSIKIGKEYEVFEYGPFGNECEMYEIKAGIEPKLTGKKNPRLLILYKDRSTKGKLVTPIFWETGANASNNKIAVNEYEYDEDIYYESSVSLDEVWKQISIGTITFKMQKINKQD